MERYQTAFYEPLVSDWSNFGQWTDNGSLTATQRANGIWKQILLDFEAPALDIGRVEALQAFIERRSAEGGAPIV
jgi:trimethylamine--corrinoid protein Co-methyltransferase